MLLAMTFYFVVHNSEKIKFIITIKESMVLITSPPLRGKKLPKGHPGKVFYKDKII